MDQHLTSSTEVINTLSQQSVNESTLPRSIQLPNTKKKKGGGRDFEQDMKGVKGDSELRMFLFLFSSCPQSNRLRGRCLNPNEFVFRKLTPLKPGVEITTGARTWLTEVARVVVAVVVGRFASTTSVHNACTPPFPAAQAHASLTLYVVLGDGYSSTSEYWAAFATKVAMRMIQSLCQIYFLDCIRWYPYLSREPMILSQK